MCAKIGMIKPREGCSRMEAIRLLADEKWEKFEASISEQDTNNA